MTGSPPRRAITAIALGTMMVISGSATTSAQAAARVDSLLGAMTLDEKLAFLRGARDPDPTVGLHSAGYMPGVPRLGIPPLRLSDGPAGIRTDAPATALPAPVALAASFDTALARRYGAVMGREGRARNQDVLLGPMMNIVRVPQGGRNFETLGEDPLLAARIAEAEIAGIQAEGMIATAKHYAANNFEEGRQRVDVRVDARTLHEIYLSAFEAAVRAGAGSVMCSYNRLNGVHACENEALLTRILRTRFGFAGWVMTDWFATHGLGALQAGLDQEMPGSDLPRQPAWFGDSLRAAVASGRIPLSAVDLAVRRILGQMERFGMLGTPRPRPMIDTAADVAVARDAAIRGAVLLRNDGVLPLAKRDLANLLVVGPTAASPLIGGGGSAHVIPFHVTSALAALERRAGTRIRHVPGVDLDGIAVPSSALAVREGGENGLRRANGPTDAQVDFTGPRALPAGTSAEWTGVLMAPEDGEYDVMLQTGAARGELYVDGKLVAHTGGLFGGGSLLPTADGLTNAPVTLRLSAHVPLPVRLTLDGRAGPDLSFGRRTLPVQVRLAWSTPERHRAFIREAVLAARRARAVVVFAHDEGTEGFDRDSLSLPARQAALVEYVARTNPRTVVVLNTGSAVAMPWIGHTAAVLDVWYPGEEGGDATAALLLGEANPSGKLPLTFPKAAEDEPTNERARYPGIGGRAEYSEGVLVGYRWYDTEHVEPLFPFGHGLSYTRFAYSGLDVQPAADGFDVAFRVRNAGAVAGTEVAQVYVGTPRGGALVHAVKQLAGFTRVDLAPGAEQRVVVHVGARALSHWSVERDDWQLEPGTHAVLVGSSSRDIRLRGSLTVSPERP